MKIGLLPAILSLPLLGLTLPARAGEPLASSWFTLDANKTARIFRNDADRRNDQAVTTWSNGRQAQTEPTGDGVQAVYTSADWIYIRSTGLGSHVMGPWYMDPQHRFAFPNLPTDQHLLMRIPRRPVVQTDDAFNPLGEIGLSVDGVLIFDSNDSFSYSNRDQRDAEPRARIGRGDQIWNRDAFINEGATFDPAFGHQQNWGRYHYHAEPLALRYLLGDHVDFDALTKTYCESKTPPTRHSPIIGWMQDGYPLYGPYGYASASNTASGVRRMITGFHLRDGEEGTDNLQRDGRTLWPTWGAREYHTRSHLHPTEYGPPVSMTYPLGHYIEDYAFLGDTGKIQGSDFDLDEFNGRWCVTPEFPHGTYAYFTTIDAAGRPVYPYNMGRRFRGVPSGRLVRAMAEPVTTNFISQAMAENKWPAAKTMTLGWKRDGNGGGYQPMPR